jgi:hypothetical protein
VYGGVCRTDLSPVGEVHLEGAPSGGGFCSCERTDGGRLPDFVRRREQAKLGLFGPKPERECTGNLNNRCDSSLEYPITNRPGRH